MFQRGGALALPDVILAQLLLVLLYLHFDFGEGHFHRRPNVGTRSSRVERAGWEDEVQRYLEFGFSRRFFQAGVELD